MNARSEKRQNLIQALLPAGVPRLWCPLLTHYRSDGGIDFERMTAHFRHIVPWVKGFLIPGSTGDAWELDEEETMQVVSFALQQAGQQDICLLLGALKQDTAGVERMISHMLALLDHKASASETEGQACSNPKGFAALRSVHQQERHWRSRISRPDYPGFSAWGSPPPCISFLR